MDPEYDSYGHIMESLFSLSSNYIGCNVEGHTYNSADDCSSWDVLHSLRHDCLSICWPALIMTLSEYEVQLRERRYAVQYRIFDSLPSFHSA